jgi:glycosyltransferase involved in cell wall biosynthesis
MAKAQRGGERRVLVVGDYPPPYGGLSVQIAALRSRLAALSDTTVAVLDIGERRAERRTECAGARGPAHFAATLLRHARRGFALHLHTNGHNRKSWLAAAVTAAAGAANGRRTVITLGSGLMPEYVAGLDGAMRLVVRATLRAAGGWIVRNERAVQALVALGAPPHAIAILPGFYGVAPSDVGPLPRALARFRRGHEPLIGMISSPGAEYGLTLAIDAVARLRPDHPNLGLVLIGPDALADGLPEWILSTGELDRPPLLAAVQALDVFVRPTYFDGDASSVREALALGVRVVASDTDFRPSGVSVFPRGDAEALAGAVHRALGTPPSTVNSSSLPQLLALYDALPLASAPAHTPAAPARPRLAPTPMEDRRVA